MNRAEPLEARPTVSRSQHEWPVATPYRLDLTVSVLRRLSTNVVDVFTPDGQYLRALGGSRLPVIARVTHVARNLALVSGRPGSAPLDIGGALHALSPQQGMLYHLLLLARLEARGDVGRSRS